jgi:hypothetical protein
MEYEEKTIKPIQTGEKIIFTANEVANVVGESYKTVAKILKSLATENKIEVSEKFVNNRSLTGYILSTSDLQNIKEKFLSKKHLDNSNYKQEKLMLANALNTSINTGNTENNQDNPNVKFYEVMKENQELTKEVEKLKSDMQVKINENVRLDADLSMAKSELKFITDKSQSMESAYSEQKQRAEGLEKVIKSKNTVIIVLSAILLIILTVGLTLYFAGIFNKVTG